MEKALLNVVLVDSSVYCDLDPTQSQSPRNDVGHLAREKNLNDVGHYDAVEFLSN